MENGEEKYFTDLPEASSLKLPVSVPKEAAEELSSLQ